MADDATNPAPGVEQATESTIPANDPSFAADAASENQTDQVAADDSEEIDYDGAKYKVPKPLKDAFLRHADYTKKTQEVAEQRRAIEAQANEVKQQREFFQRYAQETATLQAISPRLDVYDKITPEGWARWAQDNPTEAQAAQLEYNALRIQRENLSRAVGEKEAARRQAEAAEMEKLSAKAEQELRAKIKDWGPDKKQGLLKVAAEYGFGNGDLMQHDPRVWLALNDLAVYRASLAKASATAANVPPEAKPVPKVGGPAQAAKDPNKMSMEEYARWMNRKERGKEAA